MAAAADAQAGAPDGPIVATYFDVFARGALVGLALNHSGLEWEGKFMTNWSEVKPTLAWKCLPIIEVPGVGTVGQEMAILNYLGSVVPALNGATPIEFVLSQQLLNVTEDLYQKVGKNSATKYAELSVTAEEAEAFWTSSNPGAHNAKFAVKDYLAQIEAFQPNPDSFTASGVSVGEIKLWYLLKLITDISGSDATVAAFPKIHAFYKTFGARPETVDFLETGGKYPSTPQPYFKPRV
mmetsp:Transcript_31228/g.93701  ORF Transcript_31228/g.93701 Transcript_31228/m.93701 type:complete len:238 (-) Transcript_31228:89-802(-)